MPKNLHIASHLILIIKPDNGGVGSIPFFTFEKTYVQEIYLPKVTELISFNAQFHFTFHLRAYWLTSHSLRVPLINIVPASSSPFLNTTTTFVGQLLHYSVFRNKTKDTTKDVFTFFMYKNNTMICNFIIFNWNSIDNLYFLMKLKVKLIMLIN